MPPAQFEDAAPSARLAADQGSARSDLTPMRLPSSLEACAGLITSPRAAPQTRTPPLLHRQASSGTTPNEDALVACGALEPLVMLLHRDNSETVPPSTPPSPDLA